MKLLARFAAVGLLLPLMAAAARMESFEATIRLGADDAPKQGRMHAIRGAYRIDIADRVHPVHLIIDATTDQVNLLEPRLKRYRTVASASIQNLVVNPIDAFRLTSGFYPRQQDGRETMQGLECDKIVYLSNGQPLMTAWVSARLGFPLKAVNHRFPEMSFELSDVRETPVNRQLMTVPTDFEDISALPSPSALPATGAAVDEPVNEWMIKAGESQLLEVAEGQGISVKVADDANDGLQSKGKIVFHIHADPPLDRFESSFRMPNGRSQEVTYPASIKLRAIEFVVTQGAIQLRRDVQAIGPKRMKSP